MIEVAEHFVYLAIEADSLAGSRLLTRRIGQVVAEGQILAALDADGHKHLLIPVTDPAIAEDVSSQGVTLEARTLLVDGRSIAYVDVHCRMPSLDLVFERLLDDILLRLATSSAPATELCRQALDDWRTLLRTAGQGVDRETVVGLIAELEVLRLLTSRSAAAALDVWRGPTKAVHDFVRGSAELEVKATTSVDGDVIMVTNIDQLDPSLVGTLHLVVLHLKPDETAPGLDDRIEQLIALGVPRGELISRVGTAGYVYESSLDIDDRYSVRSVRGWLVDETFPGLRGSDVPEGRLRGVSNIRFKLNLGSAPPRLKDEQLEQLLADWTRSVP